MKKDKITNNRAVTALIGKAAKNLKPPACVRMNKEDKVFFNSVLAEFARSEWTEHQLQLAALLARAISDLEVEQIELRKEGAVIRTRTGGLTSNPRKAAVQMHANTILALRRSLSLNARASGEDPRDVASRREFAKAIESDLEELDVELIPRS